MAITVEVNDEEVVEESTEAVDDNQLEAELEQATAKSSKTKAINKKGITEAYPFLSADGFLFIFYIEQGRQSWPTFSE